MRTKYADSKQIVFVDCVVALELAADLLEYYDRLGRDELGSGMYNTPAPPCCIIGSRVVHIHIHPVGGLVGFTAALSTQSRTNPERRIKPQSVVSVAVAAVAAGARLANGVGLLPASSTAP